MLIYDCYHELSAQRQYVDAYLRPLSWSDIYSYLKLKFSENFKHKLYFLAYTLNICDQHFVYYKNKKESERVKSESNKSKNKKSLGKG